MKHMLTEQVLTTTIARENKALGTGLAIRLAVVPRAPKNLTQQHLR